MRTKTIEIVRDFSDEPIGRYLADSPYCGEVFRDNYLVPALSEYDRVIIQLDGTEGYGSSFLEEAFGGLVRLRGFSREDLNERLQLVSDEDETLVTEIKEYIDTANPQRK